ncbi:winged helix-turn-helix domain-containing protein [Elstera cyanobacteriorum]|uniref:winged helix-turn-helix domain-containing protein n=1 Tax=Elstera cyanobacteriorum TaxID=2022747 RepID=UPI0023549EC5|nr:winged helix-turn-helix domain-containing protein [Elstera cyanobacteriorum]MCK6441862.1 winged helix-turn-helix domain-containing protein [Elstera cyanobacteriorum]
MGGAPLWIVEPDPLVRPILAAAVEGVTAVAIETVEALPNAAPPAGALILSLRPGELWPDWAAALPTVAMVTKGDTRPWPPGWEVLEKPLHPALLRAALLRVLEAAPIQDSLPIAGGDLHLTRRLLSGPGGEVRLTEKEAALLRHLLTASAPVPRAALLAEIWGYHSDTPTRTVETHVYRLRRKIEALGLPLVIEATGDGYGARAG